MINDALPPSAMRHIVFIETCARSDDHRWRLAQTIDVEGDRTDAAARAWELALTYLPEEIRSEIRGDASAGRKVFRVSDGSWLVEVWSALRRARFRINTAEQVHDEKYTR
ncbi:hypothetical protein [Streptomyces sp. CA-146814]|uniref:hypothetical protein n=1 Tax=Streptomyces sp. CA-146814 TaxID=3240053 RepID=UPI003D91D3A0